jgi:hypothetical protein
MEILQSGSKSDEDTRIATTRDKDEPAESEPATLDSKEKTAI